MKKENRTIEEVQSFSHLRENNIEVEDVDVSAGPYGRVGVVW